jgi:hypothetical protein
MVEQVVCGLLVLVVVVVVVVVVGGEEAGGGRVAREREFRLVGELVIWK